LVLYRFKTVYYFTKAFYHCIKDSSRQAAYSLLELACS